MNQNLNNIQLKSLKFNNYADSLALYYSDDMNQYKISKMHKKWK